MLQTLFGMGGRLSRTGFWEVVVSVLLLDVAAAVAGITGLEHAFPDNRFVTASTAYQLVSWSLFAVAVLSVWAVVAAHVKRAHDRGHGAIFLIWLIVPVIGWLWILYELGFQPGPGFRNRFGPQPLGHHEDEYAGGERRLEVQPVANDGGHAVDQGHGGGLFHRRPHRVVPTGPAVLDWTGAASEDSAEAAAHAHDHYDPAEALMRASENREPEPEPAPAPEPAPQVEQVFAPPPVAPTAQPVSVPNDLSAAMGEVRRS
jgi:uncharacterized membrane protein YhaH (DUF805 family)